MTHFKSYAGLFMTIVLFGSVFIFGLTQFIIMNAKTQVNVITQIDYDAGLETA